ncbi:hypothetical protein AB0M36_27535 [Actinoplanes sp. NPDC051346]|uniref:hypothetical protein n=1 Tax=Actinoplanes sp. NPDC051346 TaxID=3155048 RepID=UPI0034451ED7
MTSTTENVILEAPDVALAAGFTRSRFQRWLPLLVAYLVGAGLLAASGTSVLDVLRYTAYAIFAVILPGTLVFRALRRQPHTLAEDLALGAAVGLTLELAAWAFFSAVGLRDAAILWPLLVVVPFAAVPRLRRHWRVTGYTPVGLVWSWALAAVVMFFAGYVYATFFVENPILPDSESTRQYIDLAYQLSLAGEAKHNFPLDLPQVAGEPLRYHWFAFVHLAMGSMVGHIDLPVLTMRLMIPAMFALTATLTAVAGWRLTGRRYAGLVAAVLFLVIGSFNFTDPISLIFGTQVEMVVWPSLSMTYSWALIAALIAVVGEVLRRRSSEPTGGDTGHRRDGESDVPPLGWGAYLITGLLVIAASGAKASTLPVLVAGLAFAGALTLLFTRKISWPIVAMGVIAGLGQLFSMAVLFRFQTYGLAVDPLHNIETFWKQPTGGRPFGEQALLIVTVWVAFLINMQLRLAGIVALAWRQRFRLDQVQLFLLGSAVAGPALFFLFDDMNAVWFMRTGLPFGVLLSAWGWLLLFDKAALPRRGRVVLGAGTAIFAVAVAVVALIVSEPSPEPRYSFDSMLPVLVPAGVLAGFALVAGIIWRFSTRFSPGWKGRGGLVLLTGILVAGSPGLLLDAKRNLSDMNGGGWGSWPMPASRVEAARWIRDNSDPTDILATNVHCRTLHADDNKCRGAHVFWLSAYAERSVLVEGWQFAPRVAGQPAPAFWNPKLLKLNDLVMSDPTPERISKMRDRYHVRFLVVDRVIKPEGPALAQLAALRYSNDRMAVYEIR